MIYVEIEMNGVRQRHKTNVEFRFLAWLSGQIKCLRT